MLRAKVRGDVTQPGEVDRPEEQRGGVNIEVVAEELRDRRGVLADLGEGDLTWSVYSV